MTPISALDPPKTQEIQPDQFSSLIELQQCEGTTLEYYGEYCVAKFPAKKPTKSQPYDEYVYQVLPDGAINRVDIQIETHGELVIIKTPSKRNRYEKQTFLKSADGTLKPVEKTAWTLSIPVRLSSEIEETAKQWQEWLRWIWNDALDMLIHFDRMHGWDKVNKQWVPCCPLTLKIPTDAGDIHFAVDENTYRWYKVKDEESNETFACAISVPIATDGKKHRFICARGIPYEDHPADFKITWKEGTEPLRGLGEQDLARSFSQKTNPDKDWYKNIPQQPVRSLLKDLSESYNRWRKNPSSKDEGRPQFKNARKGQTVKSLVFEDPTSLRKEFWEDGTLRRLLIPKLGWIDIPREHSRRWGSLPLATVKLVNDMGWSIQLTTSLKPVQHLKPKSTVATIEIVGKEGVLFRDEKKEYTIPIDKIIAREEEIRRVQREISRQLERYKGVEVKPQRWLKYMEKLKQQLKWLHRKQRLSTKARHQKLVTFALRRTGTIKLIDKKSHTPIPVPEPVVLSVEKDQYGKNGREQVKDINRARRRYATGMLVACFKQKAPSLGRTIEEEKPETKSKKEL